MSRGEVPYLESAEGHRLLVAAGFHDPMRTSFTPALETLEGGLGETFGAMSEVMFVAALG